MRNPLLLGLAAVLAGCSTAPAYRQPASFIEPIYSEAGEGTRLATDIGWRDYFGDPRLRAYLEAALSNNRDLAASLARIAEARAEYRIQESSRLPHVDAAGQGARTKIPLGGSGLESLLPAGGAPVPASLTYTDYQVNATVTSFELDLWGRVRNLSEAAKQSYLASVEGTRAFKLMLIGNVAATYLQTRAGEAQIALADRTVASRREGVDIAKLRLDAGVTSTIDYDQAVTLLTQARTNLADVQRTSAQSANLLLVLVGGPIAGPLPSPRAIDDEGQFDGIDAGLPSALLTNRPDILQAERQLRATDANIGVARAAFFPKITLTGTYGYSSGALSSLFDGASQAWSFGGAATLPVLDWGQRRAELGVAKAQRQAAVAGYEKAVQVAFREVSDGLVARRRYREQIAAQIDAVTAEQRLAETARLRYQNGIAQYLEVLDAERNEFAAQQQLIMLKSEGLQNGVSLYIALGGGMSTLSQHLPTH